MKMQHLLARRAFTLIELLLVMVILAILATVAVPMYFNRAKQAKADATRVDISHLKASLATFETDNGRFPNTAEGLEALVTAPPELASTWRGPYIEQVPADKWDHLYHYKGPADNDGKTFDLFSSGPDGVDGNEDDILKITPNATVQ